MPNAKESPEVSLQSIERATGDETPQEIGGRERRRRRRKGAWQERDHMM